MRYYIIAGEASGDLHASRLMRSLKNEDKEAQFRFFGGDMMAAEGGTMVKHYRELAYMGFIPVLLHLPTILSNMKMCKQDIIEWQPDVVILVDYPGFNLDIAKFLKKNTSIPAFYYIAPKIWAWKEYRIKNIKRDIKELFSILPFEKDFFEGKHNFPIHYVGNPTKDEVEEFILKSKENDSATILQNTNKPAIALLAGSRRQEIKDNLPAMIEATREYADSHDIILAGAPSIPSEYYNKFIAGTHLKVVYNQTYDLLNKATAALVTSGTATLETALFNVPQVVCYETPLPWLFGYLKRTILKVKYVSLVNLVADREVVKELVADSFSVKNIRNELAAILPGGTKREEMLSGYAEVRQRLGKEKAPDNAAKIMVDLLRNR